MFFNSYEYQTKEDFLYYILFVMEQLQLNPQEQLVELTGKTDPTSELYQIVYQYVRNVKVADLKTTAQALLTEEEQLKEHYILLQL